MDEGKAQTKQEEWSYEGLCRLARAVVAGVKDPRELAEWERVGRKIAARLDRTPIETETPSRAKRARRPGYMTDPLEFVVDGRVLRRWKRQQAKRKGDSNAVQ